MIRFKAEVRNSFGSPCRSWCARPKASFLSLFELSKSKESSHEVPLARGPALSHEVPLARCLSMPFDALYSCLFWLFPCSNQIGIENPCKASIDLIEACGLGCCCCCSAVAVVAVCSAVAVAGNLCRGVEFAINPLPSWSAARYSRELAPVILHAGKTSALSF